MKQSVSVIDPKAITAAHRARIGVLIQIMHGEGFVELGVFAPDRADQMIDACLERGLVAIAREDDMVVGTLGILPAQFWFTHDWHWEEKWIFVHPAHRHGASRHAQNLLNLAVSIQRMAVGDPKVRYPMTLSVLSRQRTAGKCRLFGRYFKPAGQIFMSSGAD